MKPLVGRFALALAGFVLWLCWLAYLVLTASQPTVLSRSQFLVAECTVVVEIKEPSDEPAKLVVREVYGPHGNTRALGADLPKVSDKIEIVNLANCKGWKGPGFYILPLVRADDAYRVAPLPPSPGFVHLPQQQDQNPKYDRFIYQDTPETREQLKKLVGTPNTKTE